jgi:hypothetical protein
MVVVGWGRDGSTSAASCLTASHFSTAASGLPLVVYHTPARGSSATSGFTDASRLSLGHIFLGLGSGFAVVGELAGCSPLPLAACP